MNPRDGIRLAFSQIRAQKLKSFFAIVGVIIGVMFLMTVVSVASSIATHITPILLVTSARLRANIST